MATAVVGNIVMTLSLLYKFTGLVVATAAVVSLLYKFTDLVVATAAVGNIIVTL